MSNEDSTEFDDADEAARKARAASIREQIAQLKSKAGVKAEPAEADATGDPQSPRDAIHEKMRELRDEES